MGSTRTGALVGNGAGALRTRELTLAILRVADEADGPVGAGTVHFSLLNDGVAASTATVGRRLRELETQGVLRKEGVEGRTLTPIGRRYMLGLSEEVGLEAAGRRVLGTLRRSKAQDFVLWLEARRPIEREVARLAAQRATPEDILELELAIQAQDQELASGGAGVRQDIQFHERVAVAAHNPFLHALVSLLRHHRRFSSVITSARRKSGVELGVDHHRILEAIRKHDEQAAEAQMDLHIDQLIQEVRRTYAHHRASSPPSISKPSLVP